MIPYPKVNFRHVGDQQRMDRRDQRKIRGGCEGAGSSGYLEGMEDPHSQFGGFIELDEGRVEDSGRARICSLFDYGSRRELCTDELQIPSWLKRSGVVKVES